MAKRYVAKNDLYLGWARAFAAGDEVPEGNVKNVPEWSDQVEAVSVAADAPAGAATEKVAAKS